MSDTRVSARPYIIGPTSSFFLVPTTGGAFTPPIVNVSALNKASGFSSGTSSVSCNVQQLTLASGTPNLIVVYLWADTLTGAGAAVTFASVTGSTIGALTQRSAFTFHTTLADAPFLTLEVWYKSGSFSGLTAENFTATTTGSANHDNAGISVVAYDGVGATPFTASGAVSATDTGVNGTIPTVASFSETEAGTLIFGYAMSAANVATGTPSADTGWTSEFTLASNGGTDFSTGTMEDKSFTAAQSGITVQFGSVFNRGWLMVADAIVGS